LVPAISGHVAPAGDIRGWPNSVPASALPVAAFEVGRDVPAELPSASFMAWIACTYPVNLCGLPATSIPCDGLPVGLQLRDRPAATGTDSRTGTTAGPDPVK